MMKLMVVCALAMTAFVGCAKKEEAPAAPAAPAEAPAAPAAPAQ